MKSRDPWTQRLLGATLLISLAVAALALRIIFARLGHNFDLESYWLTSDLVLSGRSIYADTHRYNYGPIWAGFLGAFRYISRTTGADTIERFHLFVTSFLSLIDLALALFLWRRFELAAGLLLLFNPVSILLTGFHSQFDGLGVLPGLLSWEIFARGGYRAAVIGGALLGLSLGTKHLYIGFLIWLPFLVGYGTVMTRLVYGGVAVTVTAATFLPFLLDPAALIGIRQNVLMYAPVMHDSLLMRSIELLFPMERLLGHLPPLQKRSVFLCLLGAVGPVWLFMKERTIPPSMLYLGVLVVLSSTMADQYLAIPLVLCCAAWRNVFCWLYCLAATKVLLSSESNVGVNPVIGTALGGRWLDHYHAQAWLAMFLLYFTFRKVGSPARAAWESTSFSAAWTRLGHTGDVAPVPIESSKFLPFVAPESSGESKDRVIEKVRSSARAR